MVISAYPCLPSLISALGRRPTPNADMRITVVQMLGSVMPADDRVLTLAPISSAVATFGQEATGP